MSGRGKGYKGGLSRLREKIKLTYPLLNDQEVKELISKVRGDYGGSLTGVRMVDILKSVKIQRKIMARQKKKGKKKQLINIKPTLIQEKEKLEAADDIEMKENDSKKDNKDEKHEQTDGAPSKIDEVAKDSQIKEKEIKKKSTYPSEKTCKFCFKMFLYKWTCRNHMKQAHGYSTEEEKSSTVSTSNKKEHIDNVALKHQCSVCDKVFLHSCTLKRHMNQHEVSPDIFKCKYCDKSFIRKDKRTRHQQVIHLSYQIDFTAASQENTDSLTCQMCSMNFGDDREGLFAHLSSKVCQSTKNKFELNEKHRFVCEFCTKTYVDKDALGKHVRWKHSRKNIYFECTVCSSKLKHKSSLDRHMKKFHPVIESSKE